MLKRGKSKQSKRSLDQRKMQVKRCSRWVLDGDTVILLMEEILHQLIGSLSHYFQGFIRPRWCRISSINSILYFELFCHGDIHETFRICQQVTKLCWKPSPFFWLICSGRPCWTRDATDRQDRRTLVPLPAVIL